MDKHFEKFVEEISEGLKVPFPFGKRHNIFHQIKIWRYLAKRRKLQQVR